MDETVERSSDDTLVVVPKSVRIAVLLMYVGAGATLLGFLIATPALIDQWEAIQVRMERPGGGFAVTMMTLPLFFPVIATGLWIWMAIMNGKGRPWARVLGTVFFGFACIGMVAFLQHPITAVLGATYLSIGLAAVVFMWRAESAPHYIRGKRPPQLVH